MARIGNKIGSGGFADVYELFEENDAQEYAIKQLKDPSTDDDIKRFGREVRMQSKLDHPNIVPIVSINLRTSPPHFVMPKAIMSLRRFLEDNNGESHLAVIFHIATGLQYAHSNGVVHRDMKPENVLLFQLPDKTLLWKIGDFGLGRMLERDSPSITSSNIIMGTFEYMAPEQYLNAKSADSRSDIYALGKIMYELLTARVPFPAVDYNLIPSKFRHIIRRATEVDVNDRYQNIGNLISDLDLLCNRPKRLVSPLDLVQSSLAKYVSGEPLTESEISGIVSTLLENCEDDAMYTQIVPRIPRNLLSILLRDFLDPMRDVLLCYDKVVSAGLPFEYCDTVADFYNVLFHVSEDRGIRRIIIKRLPIMGFAHNRFHVRRVFGNLVAVIKDDELIMDIREMFAADPDMASWHKDTILQKSVAPEIRDSLCNTEPVSIPSEVIKVVTNFLDSDAK